MKDDLVSVLIKVLVAKNLIFFGTFTALNEPEMALLCFLFAILEYLLLRIHHALKGTDRGR